METAHLSIISALPLQQQQESSALDSSVAEVDLLPDPSSLPADKNAQGPESHFAYQALLANLPCAIYRCASHDPWLVEFMSEGSEQITGYPAHTFMGDQKRSLATLVTPQDWDRVRQQIQLALAQNQSYRIEYRICHADGSECWVADHGGFIRPGPSGIPKREGLLINMTSQKQSEAILTKVNQELQESSRLTGAFLANVSHEIRTPLSVILTIAESLQEGIYGKPTVRQVEALGRLRRSGRHLLGLVNDILDMAKMEVGKLTLYPERITVAAVCTQSLQMVQELAQHKQITLQYENQSKAEWLWADEQRLRQILVNLLANGIKFTPEGGTVGLTVLADQAEGVIQLSVWDTGIGIAREETAKVFQPFVQLDTKLSRQYEGTGLGLTLVYYLTRLHGGGIVLETTEGQGSRFTISLPWQDEGDSPLAHSPRPVNRGANQPNARLLVLASTEHEKQKFSSALSTYPIDVTVTDTLQQALNLACEQQPDLILIETPLPDYALVEMIHQLRTVGGAFHTPIAVVTTVQAPGYQVLWQQTGIIACLSSPINFRRLAALVDSYSSKAVNQ